MAENSIVLFLSGLEEESVIVKVSWVIKEVRLLVEVAQKNATRVEVHPYAIQMASTRALTEGLRKIRDRLGVSPGFKLSGYLFMESFKVLS